MATTAQTLKITRFFKAPPSLVFGAWTDPRSPIGWWGPKGFTLESFESDLRVGGRWRIGMRSPTGELLVNGGAYRDIVFPSRLSMTHAWEDASGRMGPATTITVLLTAQDDGTLMTFEQTGFDAPARRDGHAQGWGEAFDSLQHAVMASMAAHP